MKLTLQRIAPLQAGKIFGALYGLLSLLFIPMMILFMGAAALAGGKPVGPPMFVAVGMMVLAPLFYALMGFITGLIGAWVYNLLAGWMGGFELEFQSHERREIWPNVPPAPPAP